MLRSLTIGLGMSLLSGTWIVSAGDWPQWRGPTRNAIADETGLLQTWEYPPPIAWQAETLGEGYSSLAVADGRVFTIGRFGDAVRCVALDDATGKLLWSQTIGSSRRHAMSTPTWHAGLIYALDPDGKLNCLQADTGDIVWSKDLAGEFGGQLMSSRGYGESPLVDGDRVVCTPGGPEAFMVALNRETGAIDWKATVPVIGDKGRDGACFSSIVVTEAAGHRQYVQLTGRGLIGIDAQTGTFLWGYNDICSGGINIPTPVVRDDLVFCANGYNAGSVLLKLEPGGDTGVTAREVYRLRGTDFQNHHGGIALIGDHIYGGHGSNNGLPTCVELATGRIVWKRRGPGTGSAAIAAADGRIVFRYQNGVVAWIAADPRGFALNGMFEIPGTAGDSWSHPVIANGRLYLREQSTLYVHDLVHPGSAADTPTVAPPAANWSPDLLAVRGLGASISRLPTNPQDEPALSDRQRFYRFAIDPAQQPTPAVTVITLTDDHLSSEGQISADVFAALASVAEPVILSAGETLIRDDGLRQLAELPALVGLNVELCPQLTDAGFSQLAACEKLRVFCAMGTSLSAAGLKPLAKLPALAAMDFEVCDHIADTACETLSTFPALRSLNLKKTAFEPQRITPVGIKQLALLKSLEVLDLTANDVTDAALADLKPLTQLRELNLSLVGITDAGLVHLTPLTGLRRLRLQYAVGFSGPAITDAGVPALRQLQKLEILDLTGSRLTDVGLLQLNSLDALRSLEVAKTQITAAGVVSFRAQRPDCTVRTSHAKSE